MILHVFSVFDRAAQVYGRPFFAPSRNVAIRSLTDEVNNVSDSNQLYKHSSDFDLFALGEFDDQSGAFSAHPPEMIIRCSDLVKVD